MNLRLLASEEDNFHHVVTPGNVPCAEQAQPFVRPAPDQVLLLEIDRVERTAELPAGPGFHFHEGEGLAVTGNNIDLAATGGAEIRGQDAAPLSEQVGASYFLPEGADREVIFSEGAVGSIQSPAEPFANDTKDLGLSLIHI